MPSNSKSNSNRIISSNKLHKTESKNKLRNRRRNKKKRKLCWQNKYQNQLPQQNPFIANTVDNAVQTNIKILPTALHRNPRCCSTSLWKNTYENAIRWQCQYQTEFWKNLAQKREIENMLLKKHIQTLKVKDSGNSALELTCNENNVVDEGETDYLTFMEISARHKIQRLLDRKDVDDFGAMDNDK